MKWVDPSIELVVCGSSGYTMRTFGDWEYEVLSECYDNVDYVSLHRYYDNKRGDTPSFLAKSMELEEFILSVGAMCDAVKGKKHSKKRLNLSFDEWNVWYHSSEQDKKVWESDKWGRSLPLLEDVYNFEDALLVGLMLITFIRNADRVKIACLAQLVNVIAPIMTRTGGGSWAQTIYYPFAEASRYGRGTSLRAIIDSPLYDSSEFTDVPVADAAAVLNDDGGVTVFCVNRDTVDGCELKLDLRSFGELHFDFHSVLHSDDIHAVNTELTPDNVKPTRGEAAKIDGGFATVHLPKMSWNVIRFSK